jgi:hypothetical protein
MDCDKFDRAVLDLIFNELDELTRAAALRHLGHCQRCRELAQGLEATQDVAHLRLQDPPSGFESRILLAEQAAQHALPFTQRLSRAFTIASGWATRPQIAMSALLVLMLASSLVLLKPRPGAHATVSVTEEGTPRAEPETVFVPLARTAQPRPEEAVNPAHAVQSGVPVKGPQLGAHPAAASGGVDQELEMDLATRKAEDRAYAEAMAAFQQRRFQDAQSQFDAIVEARGNNALAAELYAALAAESVSGCAAAIPRFDGVAARNGNSDLGYLATWHSATCRARLGQQRRATLDLQKLATVPAYSVRAKQALLHLVTQAANDKHGARGSETPEDVEVLRGEALSATPPAPELPNRVFPALGSVAAPANTPAPN